MGRVRRCAGRVWVAAAGSSAGVAPVCLVELGFRRDARELGRVVNGPAHSLATASFAVWGGVATVVVTEPRQVERAVRGVSSVVCEVDRVASRFRADSELQRLSRVGGTTRQVSGLLGELIDVALRAAELTGGLVDPTVGAALLAWGYDRDFAELSRTGPAAPVPASTPAPGWWRVVRDRSTGSVLIPRGVRLDLGATAKAWAADRAAHDLATELSCGVLVNLGGDIAVAGPPPRDGWWISVGEDHTSTGSANPVVSVTDGGLATSGTTRRRWRRAGQSVHHILDPRTGCPAREVWRTVSVAGGRCVDANIAATAAIVLAQDAPDWLAERGLPARLVAVDGTVTSVAGWPTDHPTGVAA